MGGDHVTITLAFLHSPKNIIKSMAEKEVKKEVSERDALWAEYVANYKAKNPVKAKAKEDNGEFKVPPVNFVGKKRVRTDSKGKTIVEIY